MVVLAVLVLVRSPASAEGWALEVCAREYQIIDSCHLLAAVCASLSPREESTSEMVELAIQDMAAAIIDCMRSPNGYDRSLAHPTALLAAASAQAEGWEMEVCASELQIVDSCSTLSELCANLGPWSDITANLLDQPAIEDIKADLASTIVRCFSSESPWLDPGGRFDAGAP
jgi:hypothetical protein